MSENIIQYVAAASNGDTDAMAKLYSKTLKASYFLAYTLSNDKDKALEITKKSYAKAFCTIDKLKRPEAFEIWMKQNVALVYKEGVKFVFSDADAGAVENSSEFLTEEIYNDEEASAKILFGGSFINFSISHVSRMESIGMKLIFFFMMGSSFQINSWYFF